MVRKTDEQKKRELEDRRSKIDAKIKAITAREAVAKRNLDTRRKVVIGESILQTAGSSEENRQWLLKILKDATVQSRNQKIITGLIEELEATKTNSAEQV